ncbi:MAG: sialidase family protein [Proteobacteria bacterium]|nr:sialidase family protein [Pseudomonadota bacterium]
MTHARHTKASTTPLDQQRPAWLRGNLRWLCFISCLTLSGACTAIDHTGHGSTADPRDMKKSWAASLARQALSVSAAFDTKGGLWMASVKDGHILVSHSLDNGKTFSVPVVVNPEAELVAAIGENRPKILVSDRGYIYISYTLHLETPFAGNILFSRSVDGGRTFSTPITVNDNRDQITHRFDSMAIDKDGRIHIAWVDKRDAATAKKSGGRYSGAAIYYATSDDEGKTFHTNIKAADHSCECCRVPMAIDRDGTPIIMWRHIFGKNTRDHAMMRLDGKSSLVRVSHANWEVDACPHHGPAISIADDGVYHFAWFSNSVEQRGLFYTQSSDRGNSFSRLLNFGNPLAQASHPDVLSLGKRIYIVWKEFDGVTTRIYLIHSSDGGNLWSAPQSMASTAGVSDYPFLISDGQEGYLSWSTLGEGYHLTPLPKATP